MNNTTEIISCRSHYSVIIEWWGGREIERHRMIILSSSIDLDFFFFFFFSFCLSYCVCSYVCRYRSTVTFFSFLFRLHYRRHS